MRPGGAQGPAGVAGLRSKAQRSVAAEVVGEIDCDGPCRQVGNVDPGEEAAPAAASAAGLQAERLSVSGDTRVGAEPARVAESESQLGPAEVHVHRSDSMARE